MIVGVDVGTQSLKAVVCDDALAVRGAAAAPYPLAHPRPGWAEQDPRAWERALGDAIARALAAAGAAPADVRALGVAGQLDGCVPVDAAGAPLGPCLVWMDRRAADALPPADGALAPARFRATTGQILDASHLAAKARWLDREADRAADRAAAAAPRAARFHVPVSYLVARLTGRSVIDPAHASTTMLWDLAAAAWSPALCAAFAIDPARLPEVAPAAAIAGALTAAGAALTGLGAGTPVAVGTGDDFATPLGAGVVAPGTAVCVLGTAEVVGALAAAPAIDRADEPLVETHAYPAPGAWFVENPGWVAGGAVAWLGALTGLDAAALDRAAAAVAPGADGVTFLPALGGAMAPAWHPGARGAFYGLTPAHGAGHLARAVLEACAFAARDVVERLDVLGVAAPRVLLTGGGAASSLWARIRADALGRPHAVAALADTCALGAAMLAGVAAGAWPSVIAAASLAPPPAAEVAPDPAARAAYDDAHARYRRLFDVLRPMF